MNLAVNLGCNDYGVLNLVGGLDKFQEGLANILHRWKKAIYLLCQPIHITCAPLRVPAPLLVRREDVGPLERVRRDQQVSDQGAPADAAAGLPQERRLHAAERQDSLLPNACTG